MERIFLGYQNINRDMKDKAVQKEEVNAFVVSLIGAGFPEAKVKTMPTGVWITVTGTPLTIQTITSLSGTKTSLCDKDNVLASCEKNMQMFADPYVVYSLYPAAIKRMNMDVLTEATEEMTSHRASSSSLSL